MEPKGPQTSSCIEALTFLDPWKFLKKFCQGKKLYNLLLKKLNFLIVIMLTTDYYFGPGVCHGVGDQNLSN